MGEILNSVLLSQTQVTHMKYNMNLNLITNSNWWFLSSFQMKHFTYSQISVTKDPTVQCAGCFYFSFPLPVLVLLIHWTHRRIFKRKWCIKSLGKRINLFQLSAWQTVLPTMLIYTFYSEKHLRSQHLWGTSCTPLTFTSRLGNLTGHIHFRSTYNHLKMIDQASSKWRNLRPFKLSCTFHHIEVHHCAISGKIKTEKPNSVSHYSKVTTENIPLVATVNYSAH